MKKGTVRQQEFKGRKYKANYLQQEISYQRKKKKMNQTSTYKSLY